MKDIIYGSSESYRHMCRYQSGFFFRHELTLDLDYYWRVEPGIKLYCDLDYDPFVFMQMNNKTYGFTMALYEYFDTVPTLWDTTKQFIAAHPNTSPRTTAFTSSPTNRNVCSNLAGIFVTSGVTLRLVIYAGGGQNRTWTTSNGSTRLVGSSTSDGVMLPCTQSQSQSCSIEVDCTTSTISVTSTTRGTTAPLIARSTTIRSMQLRSQAVVRSRGILVPAQVVARRRRRRAQVALRDSVWTEASNVSFHDPDFCMASSLCIVETCELTSICN